MSDWTVQLTCTEDGSSKFWRARVVGSELQVNYGKIGADGQMNLKSFGSPAAAADELEKLAKSKRKKGYADVEGAAAPAPAPMAPPEPELPKQVELTLDIEGQRMNVALAVEGASIRTTVLESYGDEPGATAAFQRIVQAMLAEGYKRVR